MKRNLRWWRFLGSALLFFLALSVAQPGYAQSGRVTGTVVDAENSEPVIGALIKVVGTTSGTVASDIDGRFSIDALPTATLEVTFLGYKPQRVAVSNRSSVGNVALVTDAQQLESVIVTGYGGTTTRSKSTNSIASVKSEVLTTGLYSNPAQALAGAVSGLRVLQSSGSPGATPTVILRGGTNLDGSGSPLVVVDGQVRGSMADINPEDIASMEVLKDAGATAIYGARANNGVILIQTKKGKTGTAQINAKVKIGVGFINNPYEFLGAQDYLTQMRLAYQRSSNIYQDSKGAWQGTTSMTKLKDAGPFGTGNLYWDPKNPNMPLNGNKDTRAVWSTMNYTDDLAFLLNEGWSTMIDPVYGGKLIYKETFMEDFNINSPSLSQDYNLNVSGGNENGHYYASLGYNNQQGLPVSSFYSRLNFMFNGDYKIAKWLTAYSNVSFTEAKWNNMPATQTDEASYFSRVFSAPSTFRGYNADGEMLLGGNANDGNQQYNFDKFIRNNQTDKFTLNQAFNITFTEGLELKLNGTWYYEEGNADAFNKDWMSQPGVYNTSRNASASFNRKLRETYNAVLSYKKTFGNGHNLNAMLGTEYYNYSYWGLSASGSGAPTDDFGTLDYTKSEENMRSIGSSKSRQRILSFFGRVNYDYQDKYIVSVVARQDGYSTLSEVNRWGFFPGVSAAWVISKEDFFGKAADVLSFAKIRASFGLNGNVTDIGDYDVQGRYGNNKYNNNIGYLLTGMPNPYLQWEKSETFEVGADLGFLNNRINASLTYYNRLTKDKLASITLPVSSGLSGILSNNGEVQNQGFEFDLNFRILQQKDWSWTLGINGAYNINKIVKLPNNGLPGNRQNSFEIYTGKKLADGTYEKQWVGGYQEGEEPGGAYGFVAEGIYQNSGEISPNLIDRSTGNNGSPNRVLYGPAEWAKLDDAAKAKGMPIQAGDVRWKDVNGDNVIDNYDRVYLGNTTPRWSGGFSTTVSWKGLSLYANFNYALGFVVNDTRTPWIMGNMQGSYNSIVETLNAWSPENPAGSYPMYVFGDQNGKRNYARSTSMFVENGDYLGIREVSLSYRFPTELISKAKFKGLEVAVTGQNLGYITGVKHMFNPDVTNNWGGYPLPRTVIFSLNITF